MLMPLLQSIDPARNAVPGHADLAVEHVEGKCAIGLRVVSAGARALLPLERLQKLRQDKQRDETDGQTDKQPTRVKPRCTRFFAMSPPTR